ncbi:MAG TPA: hypothetical protein VKZ86_12020 [Cyclobacteriaceae bacterium]|nr:hypothetical protein [Cyclobacteriaceae bacterium]
MNELQDKLLQIRERPCLSVIVPQYRVAPERTQNPEMLRKAIQKAKTLIEEHKLPGEFSEELDRLTRKLSFPDFNRDGVGIFISSEVSGIVSFPFPIEERVVVDESFVTRDLYYLRQLREPYYVASIGKKQIRLYSARADELTEITTDDFPLTFEDEFEYARPAPAMGPRQEMGKEKSTMIKVRTQSFFRDAISSIAQIMGTPLPLIVAGTVESIADFRQQDTDQLIRGEIVGSFDEYNFQELRSKAFEAFLEHRQRVIADKIKELQENDVPERTAKGVQEVWRAAQDGRGLVLLVEKDYERPGYVVEGDPVLYLNEPPTEHTTFPAAVDEIIETVVAKSGSVLFADNDSLLSFDRIALQLRY